jgi:tRNA (adenine22-N1)-methyltransferase
MKLTQRLEKIAHSVPEGSEPVDVGTDHCYLPVFLIEKGICSRVIATELNRGPYTRALQMIKRKKLSECIDLRLGYGLEPITPGEVDTVIISGMGGNTILEILERSPLVVNKVKTLILQPMNAVSRAREYLIKSGFKICDEMLVYEGKRFYEVIKCEHGKQKIEDEIFYEIGFVLPYKHDPMFSIFVKEKIARFKKALNGISKSGYAKAEAKRKTLKTKIQKLQEVLTWL